MVLTPLPGHVTLCILMALGVLRFVTRCSAHRFATQDRNALLLYNGRFNEKHDFIALEIVEEQLQLTFSAGEAPAAATGWGWGRPPRLFMD